MKSIILMVLAVFFFLCVKAQIQDIDLAEQKGVTIKIDLDTRSVRLVNFSKNAVYIFKWEKITISPPPFDISALASGGKMPKCNDEVKELIANLDSENDEAKIKEFVKKGRELINKLGIDSCTSILKKSINETEQIIPIPFVVQNNQVITLTVSKTDKAGKPNPADKWSYTLKTPEKSRWLIHYGLTYTPSAISKVEHYHSFADTSVANRYTVSKNNGNGPKAWENISATINFTYPFHGDSRNFDGGFTAGFGISAGLELSGHAGLSAIIGENVILSTGIAFMQKQKLKGQYKEGQIIKENLSFDALHEKVWLPEIFFTIGFRFGSNPFVKKESKTAASKTTEE